MRSQRVWLDLVEFAEGALEKELVAIQVLETQARELGEKECKQLAFLPTIAIKP